MHECRFVTFRIRLAKTATDSKCRRATKPKAQNERTLSSDARGDDILNRSQLCVSRSDLR